MSRRKCTIPRSNLGTARVRAVRARKAGMRTKDIAATLGVNPITVSRWIGQYRRGGARALRGRKSTGRPKNIDCNDFAPRLARIVKCPATKFGFLNPLWNTQRLLRVCKDELGVKMSKTTLWRSLREIGLSYQMPERRAFEADEKAREEWINKLWPKIRRQAKKERAVILFEDESTLSLTPTLGKTWAKIGKTPVVKVTGKKGSIGVISAISITGKLLFKIPKNNVDSAEFISFLKQVLREIPRKKIYMITDNGSSHKSKMTREFVATEPRLQLIFLPAYSPDYNPDEYTWGRLIEIEMKAHDGKTKSDLKLKTLGAMRSIQKKPRLVKSFFKRSKLT